MKKYISIFLLLLISCNENKKSIKKERVFAQKENINLPVDDLMMDTLTNFKVFGNKEIKTINFPKKWKSGIYEATNKKDSIFTEKLNQLSNFYYDYNLKINKIENIKPYKSILENDSLKIDSLWVINKFFKDNYYFEYIKSRQVLKENILSDFAYQKESVDMIIYQDKSFFKKINLYFEENFSVATKYKLSYLDKKGNLYTILLLSDEMEIEFIKKDSTNLSFQIRK